MYILRLDDAAENMNWKNWQQIEKLLDKYNIKPIYGIIPNNMDIDLLKYDKVDNFWDEMNRWNDKGWIAALHGCTHVFETNEGGINPVNMRSEFAGVPLERQRKKIREGLNIMLKNGINPKIFFAPAHTFDMHTLDALRIESDIRIISDTIANNTYFAHGFYFIPQQSGKCRNLPFKVTTFCHHPNTMTEMDFIYLEKFLEKNHKKFINFSEVELNNRKISSFDKLLQKLYFFRK